MLEWRTSTPSVDLDQPVNIGLYAVGVPDNAQDDPEEAFIAADIRFGWDQTRLQFLGLDPTSPAPLAQPEMDRSELLFPDFPCNANETVPPTDGDGFYWMTTRTGLMLIAPPEGLLLTTFRFRSIALGTALVEAQIGTPLCYTRVFDEETPNLSVLCFPDGYGRILIEIEDIPCESVSYSLQPSSAVVCEGATVTLMAAAEGTPPLAYQWRKEGVTIPGATSDTYVLSNMEDVDTGNYDVVTTNECGSLVSDAATVLVWPLGTSDANGDGAVDGLDVAPFIHVALASPNGPPDIAFCAADINNDGVVNLADAELFVSALLAP